jgi:hypothetical protein
MSIVVGAHAALLFGIAGGLGVVPLPKFTEISATVIDDYNPPPPTTPPPDFKVQPNDTVQLPLPDLPLMPADNPAETITATLVPIENIPEGTG